MTTPSAAVACGLTGCPQAPAVQWRRRTAPDHTEAVFGCLDHAISLDAAALVHASTCTAPSPATLPACDCTPEPLTPSSPTPDPPDLPPGWATPVA